MKGKSLLSLSDWTSDEILSVIQLAKHAKADKRSGKIQDRFKGKNLAMIFEKRSTRTRCAFETAFAEEGGHPVFLSTSDIQLGGKESIEDTARVLGRMFDAIEYRGFKQAYVEALAKHSGIPVYNGLTDDYHPTQVLADIMTLEEEFGSSRGRRLCFVGDGRNNVAVTLMIGCAKLGIDFTVVSPPSLFPPEAMVVSCRDLAKVSGASISVTDSLSGVEGADALYTDVWVSMGEESKLQERKAVLGPYQVNQALMDRTGKRETIFLHCLPAVKGNEVTEEVFEGPRSKVFDQAENRKHTIKAVLLATLP